MMKKQMQMSTNLVKDRMKEEQPVEIGKVTQFTDLKAQEE